MFPARLSFVTCFALISIELGAVGFPAYGQDSVKITSAGPAALTGETLTREFLEGVIRANYQDVKNPSVKDDPFIAWELDYTSANTKAPETLHWTVSAQVVEKPGQARMARVWFRCKVLPKEPDNQKLQEILLRSGGDPGTRAYFRVFATSSNTRELAMVLDVPAEDVTNERFPVAIDGLLHFAYKTSSLWGSLDQPIPQQNSVKEATPSPVTVKLEQLAGAWSGKASSNGKNAGEWSLKMEPDGFFLMTRADLLVDPPKMQILTGQAKIVEAKLNLNFHNGQTPENYDVELQQQKLTLTTNVANVVTKVDLSK